ncbi:complement resistance protein TraT [Gymnodinialimonas ceratoperidinii]|uniref:Complement resistance protein TraT n=1 Tax=Gymnodinialimonas ceratoperidinii TaxID=2856823 RepID=A0A8F6TSD4_9RHOB|nr:complement resistance protein TraT [Gymnodinialimonas ceratoperidinii]QXT38096.1 complement resistance protein TraT [Gymnodinialimonas ceratoperidinii]
MLNFMGAVLGLVIGALLARKRGGNWADIAQYGAVFALIGFLLGTLVMLVVPAPQ